MDDKTLQRNLIQRVNIGDALTRTTWRTPDEEAVVDGDRRLTYTQLNAETNRLGHTLLERGIGRGDPVVVMAGNCAEFLQAYFALAKIGAIAVPINLLWGPGEVGYVVDHCKAQLALVEPMFAPLVNGLETMTTPFELGAKTAELECYVEDRDPVAYMYTSGTTSAPKGVVTSHVAQYIDALTVASAWRTDGTWRYALFMPLFHTAALALATTALLTGSTVVLMRGFDPVALLETIERERISYFLGLPIMIRTLMETPAFERYDLSSLEMVGYAMAPMPDEDLRRAIDAFGCDFALGFGQTEMAPVTSATSTRTGFSGSRTGSRTWSRPAARTWRRSRSSARSTTQSRASSSAS